jgi:serine/threonine protein phosphatase PrpC
LGNHGDKDVKKSVINLPYFWTYEIDPTLECIIIATEGLWQVLRYDVVVDIVTQVIEYRFFFLSSFNYFSIE